LENKEISIKAQSRTLRFVGNRKKFNKASLAFFINTKFKFSMVGASKKSNHEIMKQSDMYFNKITQQFLPKILNFESYIATIKEISKHVESDESQLSLYFDGVGKKFCALASEILAKHRDMKNCTISTLRLDR
jgi:hypothetical protein